MKGKEKDEKVVMSHLDYAIIERVKEIRKAQNFSQDHLSVSMGLSEKFVGNVENPSRKEHYNIRHLNLIARALKVPLHKLLPEMPQELDMIELRVVKTPAQNKDGSVSKKWEKSIEIHPI